MTDKAEVADAIKAAPVQAAESLLVVQAGLPDQVTMAVLIAVARLLKRNVEDVAADEIERRGLSASFVLAMKARGVDLDTDEAGLESGNFAADLLDGFIPRAQSFRCRVLVNNHFSGSGCLVSPSLVLTAWHVIATAPPGSAAPSNLPIDVELSDGTKRRTAVKPSYFSTCTELEYAGKLPVDDADFHGHNDVALIKLDRPDGMRLGFAELPAECAPPRSRSSILLLHFPQGNDKGFGFGKISRVRGVNSRWKHDVLTAAGSSGGPCFNTRLALSGLHQGKWVPDARLVPTGLFLNDVRPLIERDIAPPILWSLDGTTRGQLIIGRDLFFEAIAAAARPTSRVRGLRVKRRDLAQGTTGLAFSLEMLKRTLARNSRLHRTVRVNFETPISDLLDEIRRRAIINGVDISPVEPGAGAGARAGETTLEAAVNDRARNLSAQLNAVAERDQRLIWFMFDNPPAGLADGERYAFEAFIDAALRQPRLRLSLTGFETITTPGEEFANASLADIEGAPGLVVEYFGLFSRRDVESLLTRACNDFGAVVDPAVIADRTNQILQGLPAITGQYSTAELETVAKRAVPHLDYLASLAGALP
jgi:hypothetical protein